jgi:hypothetical protein
MARARLKPTTGLIHAKASRCGFFWFLKKPGTAETSAEGRLADSVGCSSFVSTRHDFDSSSERGIIGYFIAHLEVAQDKTAS